MSIFCSTVLDSLRNDFGALWKCKKLGDTLEIVTPFLLPNHDCLSIFITERGARIIVTDGGELEQFLKEDLGVELAELDGFRDHLLADHKVFRHVSGAQQAYYFKETENPELIPSLVFDLGNFAVAFSSAAATTTAEEADNLPETVTFKNQADDYIRKIAPHSAQISFRAEVSEIKANFSAVITYQSRLSLVYYVYGFEPVT
jgi:hypothetical protein